MSSICGLRGVYCAAVLFAAVASCGEASPSVPETKEAPKTPAQTATKTADPSKTPAPDDPPELPRAKLEDGVFLQSGDLKITVPEVEKVLLLMLTEEKKKNPKNVPAPDRILRARIEIAQVLLQNALIEKYARDNKLDTKKEELDKFIELKKSELQREGTTFEQMLADSGQSETDFRRFWGAKIAIEKHAAASLTDAEIDEFFNKNKDDLPLRSAAHILFQYKGADAVPKIVTRTKEEARALAEDALKKAKEGKEFAELANASDDEATKTNGGALAPFPMKGKEAMVEAFGKAVYSLAKIGDISPVVETPYGFHVIKLTAIRDAEYKGEIRRYLAAEKFNELMKPVMLKAVEAAKFNEALTSPVGK